MSRSKPKPPNDSAELLPDPEAVDKLTAFFDSLGSDGAGAVSLYAVDPTNRLRRSFLLRIPDAAELDGPEFMSQVLERYGAGEYFAESRDPDTGQIGLSQRFEVGGIGKRGSMIPPAPSPAPIAAAVPTSQVSPELAMILERQTALLERLARPAPPLLAGLNVPEVITAVTSALVSMRELVAPPAVAPAPAANPSAHVDLILKGIELARELRDDAAAGSEEGVLGVFRELLRSPLLAQALEERKAPRPKKIAAPARPASEAAVIDKTAPASPTLEQPTTAEQAIAPATMRRYLSALVTYAERGSDPALYAELALDNVPEDVLVSLVDRPDALEAAVALLPAVEKHREWFSELLAAVRAALADEPADPAEIQRPAANGAAASAT